MNWQNAARIVGVVGAVVLWAAGPAAGRVLVAEDYRTGVASGQQQGGQVDGAQGWRAAGGDTDLGGQFLEYDLGALGLGAGQGTVELTIRRDEARDPEAAFAFVDDRYERLFVLRLYWEQGLLGSKVSAVEFYGSAAANYWYTELQTASGPERVDAVSLGRRVNRGETVHLAMTWGGAGGPALYLDGQKLAARHDEPFSLPEKLAHAAKLIVGAETSSEIPGGAWSMSRSPIASLRVHDVALNPDEFTARVYANSVAAEKTVYGAGQEIAVTLRGAMDKQATLTVEGVATDVAMAEVDDGVYVGKAVVPAGVNLTSAALTGTLTDPATGEKATLAGAPIAIDGDAPAAPGRILASVPWAGEVEVSWDASAAADVDHYLVYRGEGVVPNAQGAAYEAVKGLTFVDTAVVPGLTYQYAVAAVDRAGNVGPTSEVVSAAAVAGEGPVITGITVEPFGKPVKPGQIVMLTVTGQSGGQMSADLGELVTGLALTEEGRTGRYVGTYTIQEGDVGASKLLYRVVAHLADAYGASDLAGPELAVVGLDALNDHTAPVIASAGHDGFQVAGFSGKLVPGDILTVTLTGEPAGYASFSVPGVTSGVAMVESTSTPGTYTGTYTVGWADEGVDLPVTVALADEAGNESTLPVGRPVSLDTRVRFQVTAQDPLLPADRTSATRLVTQATNANGDEVSGHELALTLSTTDEYTGVVGGGRLEDREARLEDEDNVEVKWGGVTDNFGEVAATYTAGFAAKTALIVAKDLTTGDVGAGWLNTYVASTVAIELTPRAARGAADRALLRLSADPPWLTADGRSTSRLKAVLTDLGGSPLANVRVSFALGNDNGRLKVLHGGSTDEQGVAEAEYRAGTLAGFVTVTAAAVDYGVTATVQLELRADAPAKIDLVASAAKLVADGKSQATLSVAVSDIHDNPNIAVPVSFTILQGAGKLTPAEIATDRLGRGTATFQAGTQAGTAIIEARHTSRAPTEDELRRIYGTVFVPKLLERQERERIKVAEWLVKPGDDVTKGTPLVVLESRTQSWTLSAPATGTFVREVQHKRDRVELGDTLGYVEIDPDVWAEQYAN